MRNLLFDASHAYWLWLTAAAIMLAIELAIPGVFFLWLALAAATVGVISYFWPLDWLVAIPLFAVLALIYVYFGKPIYGRKSASDQPNLNQRHYNYVGRNYVLAEAMHNGEGKLTIEDTVWDISGPDMPAGAQVKITGIDGMKLKVAPA